MFAKRKARKIQVSEENDEPTAAPESALEEPMTDGKFPPTPKPSFLFADFTSHKAPS